MKKYIVSTREEKPWKKKYKKHSLQIRMEGNDVYVKLVGACAGCPMSQLTLSNGVQRYVRETVDKNLNIINATF